VLDVGGGDGGDSIRLARAGHHVTVLDPAAPLLRRAAAAAAEAGVAERVRVVQGDVDCLAEPQDGPLDSDSTTTLPFDVVICHNVLQYLPDIAGPIRWMVDLLRVGGLISLLAPNPAMDVLAVAVRDANPAAARHVVQARTVRSMSFGRSMRRIEADSVETALVASRCEVTHRFGIRCVSDLIADNELKGRSDFAADLERLELELHDREPYRRIARFWQIVATRVAR
jgi:S-adenosylmethionine-dependent methyltransferase